MSAYAQMRNIADQLEALGVPCVIPDRDDDVRSNLSADEWENHLRVSAFRHLHRIRHRDTIGVLAVNQDKYGIANYIGPNTFLEIAVAAMQRKRAWVLFGVPDAYRDEFIKFGVTPLDGQLEPIVELYRTVFAARLHQPQLDLHVE